MATLSNLFKLIDNFSSPAQTIMNASNNATKAIESASQAADNLNSSANNMATGTLKASGAMAQSNKYIEQGFNRAENLSNAWEEVGSSSQDAGKKIRNIGDECGQAANKASGLTGSLQGLLVKIGSLLAVKQVMSITDDMTNLSARLANMNDGLQTTYELQQKIFASANRAKGEFTGMADAVARLGTLASDAFTSNDEIIAFTELLQKSFKVSGASTSEQAAAMTQLSQAMAAGRLQGDEYVSIMENAPAVIQAITKYLGVSKGELKEMSSEGAITADIIKAAMFASADDINSKFETMPATFSSVWTNIKNGGLQAFQSVIAKLNQLVNTEGVQRGINAIVRGFSYAASAANWLMDVIINNWPTIETILMLIATVQLVTMIRNLWRAIPPLLAQTALWLGMHWPILLIIGVIALAISAARQFGASWEEIIGFVGGIIGVFATFFYNEFVHIWNGVAAFINFFGNVFRDPIASIKILFIDLAISVIGRITAIAQGIEDLLNKIPFLQNVNLTSGLENIQQNLQDASVKIKSESDWKEYAKQKDFMDYSDGWTAGEKLGNKLTSAVGDLSNVLNGFEVPTAGFDINWDTIGAGAIQIEGSGNKSKTVAVDISDENLSYIKDIAEKDYQVVVKQDVLSPNLNVTFGDVHETADARKLVKEIEKIWDEDISTSKEGNINR